MTLSTTLIALLTTSVWFWYSQAKTCCAEVRQLAGCSTADLFSPCRGLDGSCAGLQSRLAGLTFADAPGVPAGYVCTAFPAAHSSRDAFFVGLISWACSLPITLLVAILFDSFIDGFLIGLSLVTNPATGLTMVREGGGGGGV